MYSSHCRLRHLRPIWQGMDPGVSIRELGKEGAIFHFHAKDTGIDAVNTAMNGVLDTLKSSGHGQVTQLGVTSSLLPPGQPENVFTTGTFSF